MIYQWECRQLWQYFDDTGRAIDRNSEEIAKLEPETRRELYEKISGAVTRFVEQFSGTPEEFSRLIGTAVNDLYRAENRMTRYTEKQRIYLAATAGSMMEALKKRGITVHFGANNRIDPARPKSDLLMARKFWNDCGFLFFETVSYPSRKLALEAIAGRIRELGRTNYVMLVPEGNKTDFKPLYEAIGTQGVMTFFKSQEPADAAFKIYPFRPGAPREE
ncbi:MAG: hypothetical protein IJI21_09185 [Clostridia bacterium]|nr:hypothetical protein [Clostridia bacterium]